MPADIANFSKVVLNSFGRLSQVILQNAAGDGWIEVGRTKGVSLNLEPVTDEKDSTGRILTLCFDVKGEFMLMQTSDTEFANISALAAPDATDHPNGFVAFFTDKPHDVSALTVAADVPQESMANIAGFGFKNVLFQVGAEIKGDGGESFITVSFDGRVFREALDDFETTPLITFDI